jgi:hypothetical protein
LIEGRILNREGAKNAKDAMRRIDASFVSFASSRFNIWLVIILAALTACEASATRQEDDFAFAGTCARCHAGLSAGQVHPTFKLRCVDCHGGNDQVDVPEDAFEREAVFRDPGLLSEAHVRPKPGLARFFFANGIDDDADGEVDEGPVIEEVGGVETVTDLGEIAEPGLHGVGMGEFLDSELNRDLNYARWLNPGDLRVATVGCGSRSRPALDGEAGGGCHQDVVDRVRRSIMVNQSAVINGAYYGNESWRGDFQAARDDGGVAPDQRAGAFGYVLDYAAIDGCIDVSPVDDDAGGRAQPFFDSDCLEGNAAARDPDAAAGAPGNEDLPAFEATQGAIGPMAAARPGQTAPHVGARNPRIRDWGGKPLLDPTAALPDLEAMPAEEVAPGIPDPVDLVLRGFRAYYPMNYPGSAFNFNFTFGTSILPEIAEFKTANPFGRGHAAGCSSCHMRYAESGAREPQLVARVEDGDRVEEVVRDPTTRHREFDPARHDLGMVDGQPRLLGIAVKAADRELTGREQQRYYSADHSLTARITSDQCGLCHGFVTRVNMAYQGMAEDEQRDALARDEPIAFETFDGTRVRILDSWVREQNTGGGAVEVIVPDGVEIARLAGERDRALAELGLIPGAGGCAPNVFSEDCNNNGELDGELRLERRDLDGELVATQVVDEDLNRNGVLDLIDHVPREKSVDGRQLRYVYGGTNGSTRLMDVHFERGMHCIDCHMLQDTHGDGNLYSTNWEAIEIECEDCHGTLERATLVTSGANGGNDLTRAFDLDGRPFFERVDDRVIQRSRVTPGVFWEVPQVADTIDPDSERFDARAQVAHDAAHLPAPAPPGGHNLGSSFAGEPGHSALETAGLECYSCHTSWVLNCMGCHMNVNLGDRIRRKVGANGAVELVAGDNEVWFNNSNQPAQTNFQLLELMRSPFVLGTNAAADAGRLAPFRSSMELHVSVSDTAGHTLFDNLTFTTFQDVDGNSGRTGVATSGAAMNQTMPHTVRAREVKGCETCHSLVDRQGQVRNDHILAETLGLGAGRYPYVGDWAIATGAGGLELFEYKQEGQLAGTTPGASSRFPGVIVNPADRVTANVEPLFDGVLFEFAGTDVALVRNFAPAPSGGGSPPPPTLRDLALVTATNFTTGALVIADITRRGHPTEASRPPAADAARVFVLELPGIALALARLSPDVSDPFVYVAGGAAGLNVVELLGAPTAAAPAARLVTTVSLPAGREALEVVLAGDVAYVGTGGSIEVFDLSDPRAPDHVASADVPSEVRGLAVGGFTLYAATASGLAAWSILDPLAPVAAAGGGDPTVLAGLNGQELFFSGGHVYLAAGEDGVRDIDVTTPAAPVDLGNLAFQIAGEPIDAVDVVVSQLAGQTWLLVAEPGGGLVGLKLDRQLSTRERCLPDPLVESCGLDMDWRDPTIMGRDPSLGASDDPSGPPFFRQTPAILTGARRLARPSLWEQIGTQTGRRTRDSFMPGSGVLSLPVMQRMVGVQVCENQDFIDLNGSGLGPLGPADDSFFATGECQPFGVEAQAASPRLRGAGTATVHAEADADLVCELPE